MNWEKEIYEWKKGFDNDDITVLSALNSIIRGIFELESFGGIDEICDRMNVSCDYQQVAKKVYDEIEPIEFACKLEVIRALLIGGKIRYEFLGDHLAKAVEEYGYVKRSDKNESTNA